ncbi:MAG TPA: biotin-dependent carboxyltransferase family protein [Gemmatimonadaceae bacterium]|nr:biotin-dependent carboxyltransferase family protein [Gemmatimonadaceae bacterium]
MIVVDRAPPYLTVQDDGRRRSRSVGVPRGGTMDSFALAAGNALVGNPLNAAVLEWGLGGGSLRFDSECTIALAGARASATLAGTTAAPLTTLHAAKGDELMVEHLDSGRFFYIAVSGGIDVPIVLHSRSTYLPGRFGGLEGRLLRHGDILRLREADGKGPSPGFHVPPELMPAYAAGVVHISPGPQADLFADDAWRTLMEEFRVSAASDRTGYRLDGPALSTSIGTLPSDAGCPGAIQIPGDGRPIALMADAPTVGGYPKIAVVSDADLPILAQREPGASVRFELTSIEQSQRASRKRASDIHTIRHLAESSRRRA